MKEYLLRNWNDSCKKKGLLFFAEAMEEMLFHHSYDSFKVPTLNFKYLCFDMLSTIESINDDVLDAGNLVPLIDELMSFYEKDLIVKDIYGPKLKDIFTQKNEHGVYVNFFEDIYKNRTSENTRSKLKNVLIFVIEDLDRNDKYYNLLIEKIDLLIDKEITLEEEKELYILTQTLLSELVNRNYSLENLYNSVIKTFFSDVEVSDCKKSFSDFISLFTFKDKNYAVYFPVAKTVKDDLSQCFNLEIESNVFEMFDNNYEYIGKLKVDACDPEQARILASEIVDIFLSIIQFDKHNNRPFKLRNADVVDLETGKCYFLQEPILPIFRGNKAKARTFSTNVCPHGIKNLFHAISLHASATQSKDIGNQFLNLWTAIEVLIPVERKGSFSRINQICNYLTSVLSINYYRSLLVHLNVDLKVIGEEYTECLNETGKEGIAGLISIITDATFQSTKNKLLEHLSNYPVLQYKIHQYTELFISPNKLLNTYNNHSNRIRLQIMRIYRTRNMIVHDGNKSRYIDLILQNLHYYVDSLIELISTIQATGFDSMNSILREVSQIEENILRIFEQDSISLSDLEYIYQLKLYSN